MVESVLAISHVESAAFKIFVTNLTSGRLAPRTRQTVLKQLQDRYNRSKIDLVETLRNVNSVCTTADCWASRKRSFLGVTVHWLDSTLQRCSSCLAIRQLSGPHTYEVLARELEQIHVEFGLAGKICVTVTDGGSNFLKAFGQFGLEEVHYTTLENADTLCLVDVDLTAEDVQNIIQRDSGISVESLDDEQVMYNLPPHFKCSCHLLNLVATTDLSKIEGTVKRVLTQVFGKLSGIWNKQNRSSQSAEKIREALGTLLVTPGDTRWNSTYDAMSKVSNIISNPNLEAKFDSLCDELVGKRFMPLQKTFINEYVSVMAPVCCALDVLQGDKATCLGYLLPTLNETLHQLLDLKHAGLTICEPMVDILVESIRRRFSHVLNDRKMKLAAVVHPKFKLDWVDDGMHKAEMTEWLKQAVQQTVLKC